jgi:hypothetical protein
MPRLETVVDEFPTLSLEQVHGPIISCFANRAEIDAYLTETEKRWGEAPKNRSPIPRALRQWVERARRQLLSERVSRCSYSLRLAKNSAYCGR